MRGLLWLDPDDEDTPFPPLETALREPNGLIAAGGSLSPKRLELAYRAGVFPWYTDGQPILWWSPDPRAVFWPGRVRISRSLRKRLRDPRLLVSFDTAFTEVMRACAEPRRDRAGTWITAEMIRAYTKLHELGLAHSLEVWREGRLIGGLYGVALGRAFFGESMFSREPDGSKIALAWLSAQLAAWDYRFIDCQMPSPHLASMGAELISRRQFQILLEQALHQTGRPGRWRFDPDLTPLAPRTHDST